ncbi:hypothetical protein H101_08060 [Trichophyton interdigitale H6]|nr:hypothetical protein H101_08060 [Trichophyton interdigitale H6]
MSLHDPVERLDSCHLIVEAGDAAAYERQEIHGNEGFSVRVSGHGNAGINKRNGCFEKHIGKTTDRRGHVYYSPLPQWRYCDACLTLIVNIESRDEQSSLYLGIVIPREPIEDHGTPSKV